MSSLRTQWLRGGIAPFQPIPITSFLQRIVISAHPCGRVREEFPSRLPGKGGGKERQREIKKEKERQKERKRKEEKEKEKEKEEKKREKKEKKEKEGQ